MSLKETKHSQPDRMIQLQQQIIHYKSEIHKYKSSLEIFEEKLKEEKSKNKYYKAMLQNQPNKYHKDPEIKQYEEKLKRFEQEVELYKSKIEIHQLENSKYEEKLNNLNNQLHAQKEHYEFLLNSTMENKGINSNQDPVHSYFNYSLILPSLEEQERHILVLGNLMIKNLGTKEMTSPIVCIRISPVNAGILSGKISSNSNKNENDDFYLDESFGEEWEYAVSNWKEQIQKNGEFWLKPKNRESIGPNGEEVVFSNFDFTIKKPDSTNAVIIEAFFYAKEIPNGKPTLNKIIINF